MLIIHFSTKEPEPSLQSREIVPFILFYRKTGKCYSSLLPNNVLVKDPQRHVDVMPQRRRRRRQWSLLPSLFLLVVLLLGMERSGGASGGGVITPM
jgi:hypothetical protein